MKIELGGRYRTRDGTVIEIKERVEAGRYRWYGESSYSAAHEEGMYFTPHGFVFRRSSLSTAPARFDR
jgi:hypothetical protein